MKFFLAIVAFTAMVLIVKAQLTEEQQSKLNEHRDECLRETGVDSEVVEKARKGEFSSDIKLKEYLVCVAKKIGFMNQEGELQKNVMSLKLIEVINDPVLTQRLIDECAVQKSSPEETALEAVRCYFIKSPAHISIL